MRLIPLGFITFFLVGCFVGPVQDFVDQMDDQYFADEFNYIPTEIKPYDKKASMDLIWENKVGDNDVSNLDLIFSEEFVIASTSDGSVRKMQITSGETVWEKDIPEEIMMGVGGDFENILFITENGYLWCLDSEGNAIWKVFVDGEVLTIFRSVENTVDLELDKEGAYNIAILTAGKAMDITVNGGGENAIYINQSN